MKVKSFFSCVLLLMGTFAQETPSPSPSESPTTSSPSVSPTFSPTESPTDSPLTGSPTENPIFFPSTPAPTHCPENCFETCVKAEISISDAINERPGIAVLFFFFFIIGSGFGWFIGYKYALSVDTVHEVEEIDEYGQGAPVNLTLPDNIESEYESAPAGRFSDRNLLTMMAGDRNSTPTVKGSLMEHRKLGKDDTQTSWLEPSEFVKEEEQGKLTSLRLSQIGLQVSKQNKKVAKGSSYYETETDIP